MEKAGRIIVISLEIKARGNLVNGLRRLPGHCHTSARSGERERERKELEWFRSVVRDSFLLGCEIAEEEKLTRRVSMPCHSAPCAAFSPHFCFDFTGCRLEINFILETLLHVRVLAEAVWRRVIHSGWLKKSYLQVGVGRR